MMCRILRHCFSAVNRVWTHYSAGCILQRTISPAQLIKINKEMRNIAPNSAAHRRDQVALARRLLLSYPPTNPEQLRHDQTRATTFSRPSPVQEPLRKLYWRQVGETDGRKVFRKR